MTALPSTRRDEDALRAARLYHLQGFTMDAIARELATSRSTVSRLLSYARETGLVTISISEPASAAQLSASELKSRWGVEAHVVTVPERVSDVDRLERVAASAAHLVAAWAESHQTIGVAWGSTMSAVSRLLPAKPLRGVGVVQLNGAGNVSSTGIDYASEILRRFEAAFGAHSVQFPVPAFFDDPATRAAMWRERSTRRVLAVQAQADLAVFGVGSPFAEVPSHVYSGGYLERADYRALAEDRVVGDVCTVFVREDGSTSGIALNERATGLPFPRLKRISRRLCVASGAAKASAVRGALAARVVTDLVVDDALAAELLAA